jgi:hypothetical protein
MRTSVRQLISDRDIEQDRERAAFYSCASKVQTLRFYDGIVSADHLLIDSALLPCLVQGVLREPT